MECNEFERRHLEGGAYAHFQYVSVTFGASANVDTVVEHQLSPIDPESVNYQVVRADRGTYIYDDQSTTRRPWGRNYIVLRSSVANAAVRLLLTLPPDA